MTEFKEADGFYRTARLQRGLNLLRETLEEVSRDLNVAAVAHIRDIGKLGAIRRAWMAYDDCDASAPEALDMIREILEGDDV